MHERDAHVARSGRGCSFSPHFPCNICIDSDHVHVLFRTNGANPVLRVNLVGSRPSFVRTPLRDASLG